MFGKSKSTRFKCGDTIFNITLYYVGSGVTEYDCVDNSHINDKSFGQHMQSIYKQKKKLTNDEIFYNKYAVVNY